MSSPSASASSASSSSSWWPSFLRWVPTSSQQLEDAETRMMSAIKTPMERIAVKVGDNTINTIKAGSGPPLVLIHGFGAGIGFWCANIDALSTRYTVYAVDMLGFGRSSRPRLTFKTPQQAEDFFTGAVEGWAQSVGLKKFVLLGHSLGGYISACYALRHSNRVAHLILADPWGVPARPPMEHRDLTLTQKAIFKLMTVGNPLLAVRAVGPYGPALVARTRPDIPNKFSHIHDNPVIVTNYLYHANAQSPATGEYAFSTLVEGVGWAKQPLINRLTSLPATVPTTFIYGSHTWMDKDSGLKLSRAMSGSSILEVRHSGHHLYIDNAPEFNATVLAVADRLTATSFHYEDPIHPSAKEGEGGLTEKILTE